MPDCQQISYCPYDFLDLVTNSIFITEDQVWAEGTLPAVLCAQAVPRPRGRGRGDHVEPVQLPPQPPLPQAPPGRGRGAGPGLLRGRRAHLQRLLHVRIPRSVQYDMTRRGKEGSRTRALPLVMAVLDGHANVAKNTIWTALSSLLYWLYTDRVYPTQSS